VRKGHYKTTRKTAYNAHHKNTLLGIYYFHKRKSVASFLKQRLVGAIVLISLGIIFIPMLLTGRGDLLDKQPKSNVPPKPVYEIEAPVVLPMENEGSGQPVMQPITGDEPARQDSEAGSAEREAQNADASTAMASTAVNDGKRSETDTSAQAPTSGTDAADQDDKQSTAAAKKPTQSARVAPEARQETAVEQAPEPEPEKPVAKAPARVAKAEDASSSTPASPKPVVSGWIVQLGSFAVENNALKLRDKLRKNGHASFVETYQHDGKTRYRVRVGPEQTRELANQLKTRLKQETQLSGLVMAFPQ
jgi:DedD protein